jgi:Holliday junction resolvase-like predicted endonuclease
VNGTLDPELVTGHARRVQTAATYLREGGATVLDTSWDCADGQLDIVYTERGHGARVLTVVKVMPFEGAVSRADVRRLKRMAVQWLMRHDVLLDDIRVDVIRVQHLAFGQLNLEHVHGVPE